MSSLRVLVVDDSASNRDVACKLFGRWGIEPVLARDGIEAVDLVAAHMFDFVLMDIVMPLMDGYTATHVIRRMERADPARRPVPVVACSSTDLDDDPTTLKAFGFSEAVKKPFSPGRLHECLLRWCPDKFDGSDHPRAKLR